MHANCVNIGYFNEYIRNAKFNGTRASGFLKDVADACVKINHCTIRSKIAWLQSKNTGCISKAHNWVVSNLGLIVGC